MWDCMLYCISYNLSFFLGILSRQVEDCWEHGHGNETSESTTSAGQS